jgi:hypothetical protein
MFFAIVEALFGSSDEEIGRQMIPETFIIAPKKSAKTSYGASLLLTGALMNPRPHAEIQLIAPTKAIADSAFKQIRLTIAFVRRPRGSSGYEKEILKMNKPEIKALAEPRCGGSATGRSHRRPRPGSRSSQGHIGRRDDRDRFYSLIEELGAVRI